MKNRWKTAAIAVVLSAGPALAGGLEPALPHTPVETVVANTSSSSQQIVIPLLLLVMIGAALAK